MGGKVLGPGTAQGIGFFRRDPEEALATFYLLPPLLLTQCYNVAQPTNLEREKEPSANMTFSAMTNLGMRLASCFA